MKARLVAVLSLFSLAVGPSLLSQTAARLTVDTSVKTADVSPMLYGLMTEEINYSYDGGLYAEMIRNRIFNNGDWQRLAHWTLLTHGDSIAEIKPVTDDGPSKALPYSLQVKISNASENEEAGVANDGYWGMEVRPSTLYKGSFYAKSSGVGDAHVRLIANDSGMTLAEATVPLQDGDWKQYSFTMKSSAMVRTGSSNHFELTFAHPGSVLLQLVSVFPPTYHDRVNGNRSDLMEMMAALHPNFLRLPGGNYLEGDHINERFNWKETIGPLVDRPTHRSPWNYHSSDGMGLLEFLEWCEDLKIDPVLAVYAGYSLHGEHVVGKQLEPFVQDALDEIEYVTGDVNTKWGAVRAKDGHPEPFKLHYIEIGNEDQFDASKTYDERYGAFEKAIRAKYPQYKLIATTRVNKGSPDAIDDHYYETPEEFYALVHHYDTMDRNGPKIFVGEWATRTGSPTPDFGAALGDAAWMTSMERNSDLIVMASYAPLFTNVNPGGLQWETDLIGYDAARAYGSPSYWAQVLFAGHLGNEVVKTQGEGLNARFFWSATVSTDKKMLHLKLVNGSDKPQPLTLDLNGVKAGLASMSSLHAATRWATNSIDKPHAIEPITTRLNVTAKEWKHTVSAYTIEVMDLPLE